MSTTLTPVNRRAYINFFRDSLIGSILVSGLIFLLWTILGDEPMTTNSPDLVDVIGIWHLRPDYLDEYGSKFSASAVVLRVDGTYAVNVLPGEVFDSELDAAPSSDYGTWSMSSLSGNSWQIVFHSRNTSQPGTYFADLDGDDHPYLLYFTARDPDSGPSGVLVREGDIRRPLHTEFEILKSLLTILGVLYVSLVVYQVLWAMISMPRDRAPQEDIPTKKINAAPWAGCLLGAITGPASLIVMLMLVHAGDFSTNLFWPAYAVFFGLVSRRAGHGAQSLLHRLGRFRRT